MAKGVRKKVVKRGGLVGSSGKSLHVMSRLKDFVTAFDRGSNPVWGDQGNFF